MADNKETVLTAMKKAGKPLKQGEIAEITGIDKGEVGKVINQLKKEGKIVSPKNCYYQPK
ncbi:MAG: MarR family transcriptional regulator [Chloroflexi bacterium]|nr:MarR family transcriptional regulator [Chloroflexota bacterium]